MVAIVWIRRSMRVEDNTALVRASRNHDRVVPFYVIDEDYFDTETLGYPRVRFWRESLEELKQVLEERGCDLVIRKGKPVNQVSKIVDEIDADAVYFNRDYSPYSRKRDSKVHELDVDTNSFKDLVMFEKTEITTNQDEPYSVYSYYRDKWFEKQKRRPESPEEFGTPDIDSDDIPSLKSLGFEKPDEMRWVWNPGRCSGREKLEKFMDRIGRYDEERDLAAEDMTSRLSPHLKFGTVSIREAFWEAERAKARSQDEDGVRTWQEELAWRDFYFQMLWNHPRTTSEPFLEQYSTIDWRNGNEAREEWNALKRGKTGFPFVDAGMRQLRREGWMHNRLRMVVTSFASKDLFLDWRLLHDYFKKMFVDAELSAMIGGIQWAYSIGTDAQPYFRVFNPWTQGEKYDPDGDYIRKFVPELRDVPDAYIHRPHQMPKTVQLNAECEIGQEYPEPIVDHSEKREQAIQMFEEAKDAD